MTSIVTHGRSPMAIMLGWQVDIGRRSEVAAVAGHRFWRVNISDNNGDGFLSCAEIKLATSNGGSNICRGSASSGTASASNVSGANAAANALNWNKANGWVAGSAVPEWLKWADGGTIEVTNFALIATQSLTDLEDTPKDFTLEYSDDDSAWVVAKSVTDQTGWSQNEIRTFDVGAPGAHKYWRLNVSAVDGGSDVVLAELVLGLSDGSAISTATATRGYASASSEFGGQPASAAFDGSAASGWTNNGGSSGHIQIDLARKAAAVEMKWTSRSAEAARAPKDFTIEYSDDGSNWTVAKTVTDETGWAAGGEERTFQW